MTRNDGMGEGLRAAELLQGGWLRALALAHLARRQARPTLLALGVGATVGTGCYLAGPAIASVVSGLASLTLTWVALALHPIWQLLQADLVDRA